MGKPLKLDYVIAVGAVPILGTVGLLMWPFYAFSDSGYLYLANDKKVKIGCLRWWWYRLMLGWKTAERCADCKKIIDHTHTTNLCECAFLLDMQGMDKRWQNTNNQFRKATQKVTPTLLDVVNTTPAGKEVAQKAMEASIEMQNELKQKARFGGEENV